MRTKVLIVALMAALLALPVPAGRLTGTFSTSAPSARIVAGDANLAALIEDPVRSGPLSYSRPESFLDLGIVQLYPNTPLS